MLLVLVLQFLSHSVRRTM